MTPDAPGFLASWGAGLLVLLLPGLALVRAGAGPRPRDPFVRVAVGVGAGLSFWPVLLLFTTHLGIRWGPAPTRALVAALAVALLLTEARRIRWTRPRLLTLLTLSVIGLTALSRVVHVRELAMPPWVDSVHHHAVTSAFLAQGGVPDTYGPVLPGVPAVYHWGFHANAAAVAWLLGIDDPFALARLLLHYGQLLNVLAVLALYAGARTLFASRSAGLIAALLAGLVSWFPAYYTAWGRYTQLAGILVLVPLALAVRECGAAGGWRRAAFAGLLGAGLFLVHVPLVLFAATLLLLLAPSLLRRGGRRAARDLALAAAIALALSAPWIRTLLVQHQAARALAPATAEERDSWRAHNAMPLDLLLAPNARELISLSSLGLTGMTGWAGMPLPGRVLSGALWIAVLAAETRRRRRGRARRSAALPWSGLLLLWGWCAATMLLVNLERVGLPPLRLTSNSAAVIFAFVPLCAAAAGVLAWLARQAPAALRTRTVAIAAVAGVAIWGFSQLVDVVFPWTVLATPRDVAALRWLDRRVPTEATFAIRAMSWTGGTVAGRDGGYWLSTLTHRRSVVPPALYPFLPQAELRPLGEQLAAWAGTRSLAEPAAAAFLSARGVTHLFVGENAGPLSALEVTRGGNARPIYRDGAVAIFEIARRFP